MEHKDYLVDVLDERGKIVGQKRRGDIDKQRDRVHAVHVLMLTPARELVLSLIPERRDLPNVYARRLGATVAAIRRHDETALQAAVRALDRELFVRGARPEFLGEGMLDLPENYRMLMSAYWVLGEPPEHYSTIDIDSLKAMPLPRFEAALETNPDHFSPPMREIWRLWGSRLADAAG